MRRETAWRDWVWCATLGHPAYYILVVVGKIKKIPGTVQNFFVFASWMLLKRLISHNIAKLL